MQTLKSLRVQDCDQVNTQIADFEKKTKVCLLFRSRHACAGEKGVTELVKIGVTTMLTGRLRIQDNKLKWELL